MITQAELKCRLSYSEDTGLFTWVAPTTRGCVAGDDAGNTSHQGYRQITVNGNQYLSHRLVWLYVYGHMPEYEIDHVNGDKLDNRLSNLREVTRKQNKENVRLQANNTSGHRGVVWDKNRQKWKAQLKHFGIHYNLGRYDNIEDAVTAVKNARDCCFTHHKTTYSA